MAGTDRSKIKLKSEAGSTEKNIPAVILVEPQLGEILVWLQELC